MRLTPAASRLVLILATVTLAICGAVIVGLTAIDKYDEHDCKDRQLSIALLDSTAETAAEDVQAALAECDGFLPW